MTESTGKASPQGGAGVAWSLCLAAPLTATFLNLATATLRRAGGLTTRDHLLLAIAGTLFTLLLLQAILWLLSRAVALVWDPGRTPRLLWGGTTVLMVALVGPVWQLVYDRLMGHGGTPAEKLLVAATTWAAVLLLPLLAALWASRTGLDLADRPPRAGLLASPFLATGVLILAWAQVHWVTGIASLSSLLWLLGFAIAAVLCLFLAFGYVAQRSPMPPLAVLTVLLLVLPLVSGGDQDASRRPPADGPERILLLTVDTLRADILTPFVQAEGAIDPIEAPALEDLASDSVVFRSARSAAPWTKPATASMLTGVSPWVHGTGPLETPLPERLRTLAEELRDAGYGTAGIGRNTFLRSAFNFDQGFDTFHFFPRGNGGILGAPLLRRLAPRRFAIEPTTEELTNFAVHWLEGHQDQAFFLWLHYFDPHGPFEPPQDLLPSGDPGRIGTTFDETAAIRNGELAPSLAEREWNASLYLAEMRHVDQQIGRVIDTLKRLDLYEGTLILFASDHGEEFWEHGSFEHGHTLYDEVASSTAPGETTGQHPHPSSGRPGLHRKPHPHRARPGGHRDPGGTLHLPFPRPPATLPRSPARSPRTRRRPALLRGPRIRAFRRSQVHPQSRQWRRGTV